MPGNPLKIPTVLHVTSIWLPQTQSWLYHQIISLKDSVHNHVFCEQVENSQQFGFKNLHVFSAQPKLFYQWERILRKLGIRHYLPSLVRLGKSLRANLLHSHFGNRGWADLGAARALSTRHVVSFYGVDVGYLPRQNPQWKIRYAALFAQADRFLCEGNFMAKSLEQLGCPREKIQVQHLGIMLEDIPFRPRNWDQKAPLKILIAASFREKKGIPYALQAVARLRKDVDVRVTLIGDANQEPRNLREKSRIVSLIGSLRMESYTQLQGYQPQSVLFREAYQNHIFLSPSVTAEDGDSEGGAPISILEMAASGMPVVSSFHCDIPEIITHGAGGLLSEEKDVDGIEKNLRRLIENPDQWADLCAQCRRHLEKEYNCGLQAQKLAALYRSLLN